MRNRPRLAKDFSCSRGLGLLFPHLSPSFFCCVLIIYSCLFFFLAAHILVLGLPCFDCIMLSFVLFSLDCLYLLTFGFVVFTKK